MYVCFSCWKKRFVLEILLVPQLMTTTSSWCDTPRHWSMRCCSFITWPSFYLKCVIYRLNLPSRWHAHRMASRGRTQLVSSACSVSLRGALTITTVTLRHTIRTWKAWHDAALGEWLNLRFVDSVSLLLLLCLRPLWVREIIKWWVVSVCSSLCLSHAST